MITDPRGRCPYCKTPVTVVYDSTGTYMGCFTAELADVNKSDNKSESCKGYWEFHKLPDRSQNNS